MRAVLPVMTRAGGGAIVNVASVNAFFHPDGHVIEYGAGKAALLNDSKALSHELGPNDLSPMVWCGCLLPAWSHGPTTRCWSAARGLSRTIER